MKTEEILEGNKLIAEFMGAKPLMEGELEIVCSDGCNIMVYDSGVQQKIPNMRFHTSWDWLMPVVDKIAKTIIPKEWLNSGWNLSIDYAITKVGTSFSIGDNDLWITDCGIDPKGWANAGLTPIERTWLAVIEFIKWYNQNKKQ
jgi:hypothetical protein